MSALPIRPTEHGYVIDLGTANAAVISSLLAQLRDVLNGDDADNLMQGSRLFPAAYSDDEEREAEYQRRMRDELRDSKLAALSTVQDLLSHRDIIDEGQMLAFMQSINSLRLLLGDWLDVGDDPDTEVADADVPEHQLYEYLSVLLDLAVRAASGDDLDA